MSRSYRLILRDGKNFQETIFQNLYRSLPSCRFFSTPKVDSELVSSALEPEEFRVLDLKTPRGRESRARRRSGVGRSVVGEDRSKRMSAECDWSGVWPGARTFHPAVVPLPLRQGLNPLGAAPSKHANAELMKIPNFLHLTPPAVVKQCSALARFCSPWPENLREEDFPVEVVTSDYSHSSPTVRDPLARIVTLKVGVWSLNLDARSRDKFLRLAGERYCSETDVITLVADKCPIKQQNLDYALYLLTALYHESWVVEPWEMDKTEADMEYFDWDKSQAKKNITDLTSDPDTINRYSHAVIQLFDAGENEYSLAKYKEAAVRLLFPSEPQTATT